MKTRRLIIDGSHLTITELRLIIIDLYVDARKNMVDYITQTLSTVESHLKRIYQRLRLRNKTDLHLWAHRNGLFNNGYYQGEYLFEGYERVPWKVEE